MELMKEAERCLKCKVPRCRENCPVNTPIPEVIKLFEEGKEKEAAEILFTNNPLSSICSIVCPHERNCCGNCALGKKGNSIEFFKIEQYLSGDFIDNYEPPVIEKNKYRIAVIGAGPAGIAMSIILSLRGFSVTLIEARDKIGGVLRYGIPEFRLPKSKVDRYGVILHKLGVKFKPNTFVGSTVTLEDMFIDGYDAIFVASGTAKPNKLGLLGETLGNVHYAIDYLRSPESYYLGKKVIVVGAGNVALDAARMAVRNMEEGGTVTIINNRRAEDMTGNIHEIKDAENEGVEFVHLLQVVKLTEEGAKCVAVIPEEADGKIKYEEKFKQTSMIPANTIIVAIGQGPQGAVVAEVDVSKTSRGLLEVDENGSTTSPGVFAAGDIVSGPKTVVEAVAFTKKVADKIELYCKNK